MGFTDRQELVLDTMVMRLNEENSLRYLESKGHKIKRATYHKEKKFIKEHSMATKYDIVKDGLWSQHLERIATLRLGLKELFINYNREQDPFKKAKIMVMIMDRQPLLSFYLSKSQEILENDAEIKRMVRGTNIHKPLRE